MFGIASSIVKRLPDGKFTAALRSAMGPPMEGPGRLDYPFWDGAKITHTMADSRVENWQRVLAPFQGKVKTVLEIGSYEGQSAMFWLDFFRCQLTCIDPWTEYNKGVRSGS